MKTGATDPLIPSRADYRYIKKMLSSVLGGKAENFPDEYDLISRVFVRYGGSWRNLFLGSALETSKLKKVLRVALKLGYLTRSPKWT